VSGGGATAEISPAGISGRRLDQWLWFARLAKSRSLAARLCVAGVVTVNDVVVSKANHIVRIGDTIAVPQGTFRRTVRLLALGSRRGPPTEARLLYKETAALNRIADLDRAWIPLLSEWDEVSHR
jgi:ribosome-associated heat shock protein Hsp15